MANDFGDDDTKPAVGGCLILVCIVCCACVSAAIGIFFGAAWGLVSFPALLAVMVGLASRSYPRRRKGGGDGER